jgi:ABC-2 type transport system permease protein
MNVLRIVLVDLRRVCKDRLAVVWLLAMPLVFIFIFGSAFRGGGSQSTLIPVIDLDRSGLSGLFIEQLRGQGYHIDVAGAERQAELKKSWPCGVVVPAGFAEKILKGEAIKLTLVKGWESAEKILDIQAHLTHAILRFTKALVMTDASHRAWNDDSRLNLKAALERPDLLTVVSKEHRRLRPPPSGFYQSLPGMLVMFVMQMVLTYGGVTLVHDRVGGQFARMLAAPVFAFEVFAGKVLARVLLALLQAALLLACGSLFFGTTFGDHPWFLVPVVVSFALFAGSLSILCGIVFSTEKQVIQIAIICTNILSGLGGCWWPIEVVPDLFKTIAMCTPTYWGLHGLQSVMYFNKSREVLTMECPVLLGFAAVCLLAAVPAARRLLRRGCK